MSEKIEVHAYLAGPDVFFPGAVDIGAAKKAQLAAVGIHGHFPFDNEIPADVFRDPVIASFTIGQANERMMLDCCKDGRIGIILANMTPYHGPSMDVGTGFEVGFMSALAALKNNVIVIGYTNDTRSFEERVVNMVYKDDVTKQDGRLIGSDGNAIESFGGADNLMITHAIAKTGGQVVATFDEAVALAKQLSDQKIYDLANPDKPTRDPSTILSTPKA